MSPDLDAILSSPQPAVMGVLNVTPDSFSDAGRFLDPPAAIEQARRMVREGADLIDVGAESTRPGSDRVPAEEQIQRLREVLPAVVALGAAVSIDTTLAPVAEFALDAGAVMVNDVSAGRDDPALLPLVARRRSAVVLMHMRGEPQTMQDRPSYQDVVGEVRDFLAARREAALAAGVPRERIVLDPGIGFGKLLEHNVALLSGIGAICELGQPVLVGPSRKRFLGELTGQADPAARVPGTIAACLETWRRGARIFRVHDVGPVAQAFAVALAVQAAARAHDPACGGNRL